MFAPLLNTWEKYQAAKLQFEKFLEENEKRYNKAKEGGAEWNDYKDAYEHARDNFLAEAEHAAKVFMRGCR